MVAHEAKLAGIEPSLRLHGAALAAHLRKVNGPPGGVVLSLVPGSESQVGDGHEVVDDADEEQAIYTLHLTPEESRFWAGRAWQVTLQEEATRRLQEHRTVVTFWGRRMTLAQYLAEFGEVNDILVEAEEEGAPEYMVYEASSHGGELVISEFTPQEIELRVAVAERMAGSQQALTGLERFDAAGVALVEHGHRLAPSPGHIEEVRERLLGMTREEVVTRWPLQVRVAQ